MKRLYLMRHATASWTEPGLSDFDRHLTTTGHEEATRMGQRLATRQVRVDRLLSSSAARARETAMGLAEGMGIATDRIIWDEVIYGVSPHDLMNRVQGFDDQWSSVMIVGHNPTLTDLANHLLGAVLDNMSPAAVAAIAFEVDSWQELVEGRGELVFMESP